MLLNAAKQRCVHHSKACCQTLKHFDNVFATGGNNIVEVSVFVYYTHIFDYNPIGVS